MWKKMCLREKDAMIKSESQLAHQHMGPISTSKYHIDPISTSEITKKTQT